MPILASDSLTSADIGSAVEVWLHRLLEGISAGCRFAIYPHRTEQRRAAAEQSRLEHVIVRQRIGDGAAYVDVVEGRNLVVHRNEGHGIVLRRRDHLESPLALQ